MCGIKNIESGLLSKEDSNTDVANRGQRPNLASSGGKAMHPPMGGFKATPSGGGFFTFEFLVPTHPSPHLCGRAIRAGGPRSAEVPGIPIRRESACLAPLGKRVEVRATPKSEART